MLEVESEFLPAFSEPIGLWKEHGFDNPITNIRPISYATSVAFLIP